MRRANRAERRRSKDGRGEAIREAKIKQDRDERRGTGTRREDKIREEQSRAENRREEKDDARREDKRRYWARGEEQIRLVERI